MFHSSLPLVSEKSPVARRVHDVDGHLRQPVLLVELVEVLDHAVGGAVAEDGHRHAPAGLARRLLVDRPEVLRALRADVRRAGGGRDAALRERGVEALVGVEAEDLQHVQPGRRLRCAVVREERHAAVAVAADLRVREGLDLGHGPRGEVVVAGARHVVERQAVRLEPGAHGRRARLRDAELLRVLRRRQEGVEVRARGVVEAAHGGVLGARVRVRDHDADAHRLRRRRVALRRGLAERRQHVARQRLRAALHVRRRDDCHGHWQVDRDLQRSPCGERRGGGDRHHAAAHEQPQKPTHHA